MPETVESARREARAHIEQCACKTCEKRKSDVLHYFDEHKDSALYGTVGGMTALVIDAHIYADALTRHMEGVRHAG